MNSPRSFAGALLLACVLAGCAGPAATGEADTFAIGDREIVTLDCGARLDPYPICYEPTLAARADGLVVVAPSFGTHIYRKAATDREWRAIPAPPTPEGGPASGLFGDMTPTFGPDGRLWITTIMWDADAPRGRQSAGVQVATSSDAGDSWDTNVFLALVAEGRELVRGADRQWLAIDPEGRAFLTFYNFDVGYEVWLSSSTDGIRWEGFRPALTFANRGFWGFSGPLAAPAQGVVLIPHFASEGDLAGGPLTVRLTPSEIRVARSTDGGKTFEMIVVERVEAEGGTLPFFFPSLTRDPDGGLTLAYASDDGRTVRTARSLDQGLTWDPPRAWPVHGTLVNAPAAASDGTTTYAAWYSDAGEGIHYSAARAQAASVEILFEERTNDDAPWSDFAFLAVDAAHRAHFVWSSSASPFGYRAS